MSKCKIVGERGGLFRLTYPNGFESKPAIEIYNFDFYGSGKYPDILKAIADVILHEADEIDKKYSEEPLTQCDFNNKERDDEWVEYIIRYNCYSQE